jgi:hypothetical protein
MSIKHAHHQTSVALSEIDAFARLAAAVVHTCCPCTSSWVRMVNEHFGCLSTGRDKDWNLNGAPPD